MAVRRNLLLSTILLYLLASVYFQNPLVNVKIQRGNKGILEDTTYLFTRNISSTLYQPCRVAVTRCRRLRHSHLGARINRYPNSTSTFQITRLAISGDISPNPGPDKCNFCSRTIARNHRALRCTLCNGSLNIKSGKVKPNEYKSLLQSITWVCQESTNLHQMVGKIAQQYQSYRFGLPMTTVFSPCKLQSNLCLKHLRANLPAITL